MAIAVSELHWLDWGNGLQGELFGPLAGLPVVPVEARAYLLLECA